MSSRRVINRLATAAILWLACAVVMMAQVKTETTATKGAASRKVEVVRAEVVYVSGNDLVVKMENGEIRHLTVSDSATATVDGKTVTVHDLKPGMKLEKTVTTTTTPKTIKTVRSGTGTVLNVMPPSSVTVRFEDNTVQTYKIPKGTTFNVDGEKKTAFDLKKGMKISATRITEEPVVEVSSTSAVSGSAPPPQPPPPDMPILIVMAPAPAPAPTRAAEPAPAPAPAAAAEPPAKKLPKTGSVVPLIGLLGVLFTGASYGVRLLRRS
jgi:hypothetical protein